MGAVYRADHTGLGQQVAVKVLLSEPSPDAVARMRREAKVVARLEHPGIVRVLDAGETPDGRPYLAMELVEGAPFSQLLAAGELPLGRRLQIIAEAARALHHAHAHGVVHRDVKPANIFVASDGRTKVLDFGVGKLMDDETQKLTRTGSVLGTFAYMAPEQVKNHEEVGAPADVYSLGATLYEAITGRPPVDARNAANAVYAIVHEEPEPPSSRAKMAALDAGAARALDAICARALAKEAGDRHPSAAAFADDVERAARGQRPKALGHSSSRRPRVPSRSSASGRSPVTPATPSRAPMIAVIVIAVVAAGGGLAAGLMIAGGPSERDGGPDSGDAVATAGDATAGDATPGDAPTPSIADRLREREVADAGSSAGGATADDDDDEPELTPDGPVDPPPDPSPDPPDPRPDHDVPPPSDLTLDRVIAAQSETIAAFNRRDFTAGLAAYRRMGVGPHIDRLADVLGDAPASNIWGWAGIDRASVGDRRGAERALREARATLDRPGRGALRPDPIAVRNAEMFIPRILMLAETSLDGPPIQALSGFEQLMMVQPGGLDDPALNALRELARVRSLVPLILRGDTSTKIRMRGMELTLLDVSNTRGQLSETLRASANLVRAEIERRECPAELRLAVAKRLAPIDENVARLERGEPMRVALGTLSPIAVRAVPAGSFASRREGIVVSDAAEPGTVTITIDKVRRFEVIELDLEPATAAVELVDGDGNGLVWAAVTAEATAGAGGVPPEIATALAGPTATTVRIELGDDRLTIDRDGARATADAVDRPRSTRDLRIHLAPGTMVRAIGLLPPVR